MTRRLLAVHAHPDDESSKGAATYAYYRGTGAEVMVLSCTGGELGDVQNESLAEHAMAERDMAGLRRIEMARAQAAMGIQHRWLGYVDSGLPDDGEALPANCFALIPLEISAAPLVRLIREFRPQVLITYDENGGYPHPDHIRSHELSMHAWRAASDSSAYPELGEPWHCEKVYWDCTMNSRRVNAVYDALVEQGHPLVEDLAELKTRFGERPYLATSQVPIGDFLEVRDEALRSHASQVPPDSRFFYWPNDVLRTAWPFDDFRLAESSVPVTLPETDLFAGVTE